MKTAFFLLAILAFAASETFVAPGTQAYLNDNNVLQYALTLEHLENAFYTQGLAIFSNDNFTAAGYNSTVRDLIVLIGQHESTHVSAITGLLGNRGATAVLPCSYYNFNFTSLASFLSTAQALEAAGVSAYDGAIASLTQTDLVAIAASVATVEARHSAFINRVVGASSPFGNYTDLAVPQSLIAALAAGFFPTNCTQFGSLAAIVPADNFRNVSAFNQTVFNQTAAFLNDNNVLQYALSLEHLENAFYATALSNISQAFFTGFGVSAIDYSYIQIIAAQEAAHVAYLSAALGSRSAVPVVPCNYTFTFANSPIGLAQFMTSAIALESIGTSAYLGAAGFLTSETLLTVAASIATVEARHTSYLRYLFGNLTNNAGGYIPFPNATDSSLAPATVLAQASAFIVDTTTCITYGIPVSANLFRPNVTVATSSSTSASGSSSSSASGSVSATSSRTTSASGSSGSRTSSVSGSFTVVSTTTAARSPAETLIVSMGVVIAALALAF